MDQEWQQVAEDALHKKIDSLRARIARSYSIEDPVYGMFLPDTVDQYGDSIRIHKPIHGAFVAIDNNNGN